MMRAKRFVTQTKPSPTRCIYYEARSSAVPVWGREEFGRNDGAVGAAGVLGAYARIGIEGVGRAPRGIAGVWPGLDGQPDSHLADDPEPRIEYGAGSGGQRCGKGEEVHGVLKDDLAGGRLPSGLFGANAAWWAIAVLAFNPVWGYGAGSELCDEAAGVGRTVGQQAPEGSPLRPDRPAGQGRAARQEVDHPSG